MSHVEPIEARRLFAFTPTVDAGFATSGRLSFSIDNPVNDVLATHGEVYVQVFQRPRNRTVIFKYTDSGVLDTSWGRRGYVVPQLLAGTTDKQFSENPTMVRDNRTGGLLVGAVIEPRNWDGGVYDPTRSVAVERYTASGTLDTAWGLGGRVTYSEANTALALPRVVALPHKQLLLALGRKQYLGEVVHDYPTQSGADDVAVLKFDARGRYDRAFNGGHALTVAAGNYESVSSVVDANTEKEVSDYSTPTFGDIQFFPDNSLRVVSTREETHQTRTAFNVDVISYVGTSVYSAESTAVTADGRLRPDGTQSYVLKRITIDDGGQGNATNYLPKAAVASANGTGIAVLALTDSTAGTLGGSLLRVGPGYRSRPEQLPDPLGTHYLGPVRRSADGTISTQATASDSFDSHDRPRTGPAILSLGHDLAVGRNRVISPLTYFPGFFLDIYTFDDRGRLLVENTNLKTNTFDVTRYA